MAYEFKKLSDVNIIESMNDNAHVLIEENGEIVKIPKDATNKGLVKTINGTEPDADGDIEIRIPIVISIIDGSAVIPGNINNYSGYSVTEIVNFFRTGVPINLIRMCIGNESVHSVPHTASDNINNGDNTFSIRVYHGDNLCPLIFNEANDTITFDPDWVAPAEPIPVPATAEVGQVIAVKAVDENGKPTEWEAVDNLNRYVPFHNNGSEVLCALSFAEADAIVSKLTNTASASLNINKMNSGVLEASTYYSNCITTGYALGEGIRAWLRFEFILPEGSVTYQFNPDETIVVVEE